MHYRLALSLTLLLAACGPGEAPPLQGYVEGEFVQVASPLAGRITAIHVVRGAETIAGAPLFTLEAEREQATVAEAEQRLSAAQAQLRRQTQLRQKGLSSIEQVDEARTRAETAQAQLVQARWQLTQKSVVAPAAGLVQEVYFRSGEWTPAGAPVVSLLPPQNRKLRFFVAEPELGRLKPGAAIAVRCDGCGEPIAARISFIAREAEFTPPVLYGREQRSRLVYRAEAQPDAADALRLHPGQPVDITLAHD